ncbi:Arm DNA-binding domain-containing protein [Sinorhizobium meliloti]|uniref:Arm DNA-binding domain-containing protein n=1 Tax=Rhizobium meliloti TaxID=382 RepID=UPI00307D9DD0
MCEIRKETNGHFRVNQLTEKQAQATKKPGNYCDGGNLYLGVRENGSKSFIVKATIDKKQREWTIGCNRPIATAEILL